MVNMAGQSVKCAANSGNKRNKCVLADVNLLERKFNPKKLKFAPGQH